MKKFLLLYLVISLIMGCFTVSAGAAEENRDIIPLSTECNTNVGDANGDGKVNLSDASMILKHIAKWDNVSINTDQADTVNDDKITLSDVSAILKYIAKWDSVRIGHNDTVNTVNEPTCQTSGKAVLTCKVCASQKTVPLSPIPCQYIKAVIQESGCVASGLNIYVCRYCGTSYTEETAPTGTHIYYNNVCSLCGKVKPGTSTNTGTHEDAKLEVLRLVNIERQNAGIAPLSYYHAGQSAGDVRAAEILQSFSHTRPNGESCFSALDEADIFYMAAGENIAIGYPSPEAVVNVWMNSQGHRENILNPDFTHLIVGVNGTGWVQLFIG